MSVDPGVLARARVRVLGPVPIGPADPAPAGLTRAVEPSGRVWLLPAWPDGATPALLEEYQTAPPSMDRPGQARRVFAAALRCCWTDLDTAPWPGRTAAIAAALEVYTCMGRGDADLMRRWGLGDLRRLADSGWLLLDETAGTVRLGPRTAAWPADALSSLRDLLRRLPQPPEQAGAAR
ncbi:hypothetical protein [Actinomadura alba]|uniref:Transcriptional regulator n=1 Tax=Actinomadura alba TaxID=406431 RepID=A0ABR7LTR9_9ACTN|nr:hypothetical protein [Actinomadura alba]MBC6468241.1 hypothetical protein [Actinomadura alba]